MAPTTCVTLPIINIILNVAILGVVIGAGFYAMNFIQTQGVALIDSKMEEAGGMLEAKIRATISEEGQALLNGMFMAEGNGGTTTTPPPSDAADALPAHTSALRRRAGAVPTCPTLNDQGLCDKFTTTCTFYETCISNPSAATCIPFYRSFNAACSPEPACSAFDDVTTCRTVRNLCGRRNRAFDPAYRAELKSTLAGLCAILHRA